MHDLLRMRDLLMGSTVLHKDCNPRYVSTTSSGHQSTASRGPSQNLWSCCEKESEFPRKYSFRRSDTHGVAAFYGPIRNTPAVSAGKRCFDDEMLSDKTNSNWLTINSQTVGVGCTGFSVPDCVQNLAFLYSLLSRQGTFQDKTHQCRSLICTACLSAVCQAFCGDDISSGAPL